MSAMDQLKNATPEEQAAIELEAEKRKIRRRRQAQREVIAESQGPTPQLIVVAANQLPTYQFPLREPLLCRDTTVMFRAGHIGEVYAMRGIGKTWLMLTLGLITSTGGQALGWHAPQPRRVLYIDGEMASADLRDRLVLLSDRTRMRLTDRLQMLGADWQQDYLPRLDTVTGQAAVEGFVEEAELIIIDNRSCLFDPEGEKDATAWQPAGDWLLSLRRRGKAVLLAHHANRQGGARGHSKAEDPMDLILKLTRPEGYTSDQGARFLVEVDKGRGVYGSAAAPFIATLSDKGWRLETVSVGGNGGVRDKILDYLRLAEAAQDLPKSASVVVSKSSVNKQRGLEVFGEMLQAGEIVGDKKSGFRVGTLQPPPF